MMRRATPIPLVSAPFAPTTPDMGRRLAVLGGAAALAGCSPFQGLQTATTPPQLYALSPKSTFSPDLPRVDAQIIVDEPTAAAAVNTDRIAVRPHPLKVEYFPGVRWVDRAPLMIQVLLMESYENSRQVLSVGRRASGLNSDFTLLTDLREFQAETTEVTSPGRRLPDAPIELDLSVNVRFNMKVVQEPEGQIVGSRSFARRVEAASADMLDVAAAFDTALGACIREAVEWSLREIDTRED